MRTREDYNNGKTIWIDTKTWKKIWELRTKYGFKTLGDVVFALSKLEKEFNVELKEKDR